MPTARREFWRSRWWMPCFSLFLGLLVLAAFWAGERPVDGAIGLALLVVVGLLCAVAGVAYIVGLTLLRWRS